MEDHGQGADRRRELPDPSAHRVTEGTTFKVDVSFLTICVTAGWHMEYSIYLQPLVLHEGLQKCAGFVLN